MVGGPVVEFVAVAGVKEHSLDLLPTGCRRLVGQVSIELVEVAGTEAKGVVVGDEDLLVVFAVEDEFRSGDETVTSVSMRGSAARVDNQYTYFMGASRAKQILAIVHGA